MALSVRKSSPMAEMISWGQFKTIVDKQLAEGNGDEELLKCVEWNGLEEPVVNFQIDRRGAATTMYVRVA